MENTQNTTSPGSTINNSPLPPLPTGVPADIDNPPAPPSSDTGTITTIVDAALTMATFASFAFGPIGGVAAGVFATLQTIFNSTQGSQQGLTYEVGNLVLNQIQDESIRKAASSVQSYITTFTNDIDAITNVNAPIPSDFTKDPDPAINTFFVDLKDAVTNPNNNLIQNIHALQQTDNVSSGPNFQTKALSTFMYCAGVHLYYYYYFIGMLNGSKKQVIIPFSLEYGYTIKGYITYAVKQMNYILGQINNRLGQVGQIKSGAQTISAGGIDSTPSVVTGLLFTDDGPALSGWEQYENTFVGLPGNTVAFVGDNPPSSPCGDSTPDQARAATDRQNYITQLLQQQQGAYSFTQSTSMLGVIQHWETLLTNLNATLPVHSRIPQ